MIKFDRRTQSCIRDPVSYHDAQGWLAAAIDHGHLVRVGRQASVYLRTGVSQTGNQCQAQYGSNNHGQKVSGGIAVGHYFLRLRTRATSASISFSESDFLNAGILPRPL